jgi:hypothetical protein
MTFDPEISEWGNPTVFNDGYRSYDRGKLGEVKHLSTQRKRKQMLFPE